MNQFDQKLRKAKASQGKLYIYTGIIVLIVCCLTFGLVAYVNGTSILVKPKDAEKAAKFRVTGGIATVISQVIYSLTGDIKFIVSSEGFKNETRVLAANERGSNIIVTLEELPGRLTARTDPKTTDIDWRINSKFVSSGPTLDVELSPGDYHLEVNNKLFEVETRKFRIERGKNHILLINLQSVEGLIKVSSDPRYANIQIDGKVLGTTPATHKLMAGNHVLEISKPDFESITDTIKVTNFERSFVRNYRLERKKATLSFKLFPQGGTLMLNGRIIHTNKSITVRMHVDNILTYSHAGYHSISRKINLTSDQKKELTIRLKPEIGTVKITSNPQATVDVNGKEVGITPITVNLPSMPHSIRLRRIGYRSVTNRIIPSSKRITLVRETLKTELMARLAEAPRTYVNSAGVTLILFEPRDFRMGAPRHEKGQRANEFLRQVKLTKPFYAGKHEITVKQYRKYMKEYKSTGGDNLPATLVSWEEAAAFCNWLSKNENLTPFYKISKKKLIGFDKTSNGYRLLMEAEWEWLARSAARPVQTLFPWGDESKIPANTGNIADEIARGKVRFYVPNYSDGYAQLAPVGSFRVEKSGIYDLTGNVSEWVHNYYSLQPPRSNSVEIDPVGPDYGGAHVIKGSSWRSGTRTTLRAAYRASSTGRRDDVGFRIGRYP